MWCVDGRYLSCGNEVVNFEKNKFNNSLKIQGRERVCLLCIRCSKASRAKRSAVGEGEARLVLIGWCVAGNQGWDTRCCLFWVPHPLSAT